MKFKVDKRTFSRAISQVENVISPREIRMIVSNVLIEAKDNYVYLTSTDLEISIRAKFAAEVITEGSSTLLARKLSQVTREFMGTELLFESSEDDRIVIKDASGERDARVTIMGASSQDYPVMGSLSEDSYQSFPLSVFLEMINKTEYAMAEDDARYVFNGIYLKSEKEITTFVATDGRRLALVERRFTMPAKAAEGVILPNKAVRELKKMMDIEGEGLVAYDEGEKSLCFRIGDVDLVTRLIDGQFPDYTQVIPSEIEYNVKIERENLEKSLRLAATMAAEPSLQVRITFQSGKMVISSSTPDLGDASDTLPTEEYEGEEVSIAFNSKYLLEVVRAIKEETVIIRFHTPSAPVMICDPKDEHFTAVVMPMKI